MENVEVEEVVHVSSPRTGRLAQELHRGVTRISFSSRVTGMTRIEILSDRGDGLFSSPWSGDASPQAGSPG